MFLRVLCVITSALTVLTTLSMTSCGADNAISSEASESAVTSKIDMVMYSLQKISFTNLLCYLYAERPYGLA